MNVPQKTKVRVSINDKFHPSRIMGRVLFEVGGENIHLAVEGSIGGTTLGLHIATDVIQRGGRVLWASPSMPNNVRFGQLFSHLPLAHSSRYHAMNLVGDFSQAMDILIATSNSLPSVELVVLDDWCEHSGRIPSEQIAAVQRLAEQIDDKICLLLTSKGSMNASGNSNSAIVARGEKAMLKSGFEIWRLERPKDGPHRTLVRSEESTELRLEETGFFH
ncbi:MAG: hypothetical protein ACI8T6_000687 [Candidatus Poseidoniaceae archaeon]|jgi:hypothetical protein|tara:strand:+ start:331 stop:987 length:657 start_codon:yes stop_codon:yes gene_type:complete